MARARKVLVTCRVRCKSALRATQKREIVAKFVQTIKKFQKWLDTNKAGWATGYKGGKVGNQKGFGLFGKRTSNAWNQYGQEYLKSIGAVSTAPGSGVSTNTNTVTTPPQTGGGEDWDV